MMIRISSWPILIAMFSQLCLIAPSFADTNDSGVNIQWGYVGNIGPERWAQLDPQFAACSKGKTQTPINILKSAKTVPDALTINYVAAPLDIILDGSTDLLLGQTHTIINDGHGVQVNFSAAITQETISFENKHYQLVQFHIHTPSETQWQNESFPLEIHFVHQNPQGEVAVLAVLVKAGAANPVLQAIIDNLPTEKGKEKTIPNKMILPTQLLPAKRDYYHFMGSLTTPPCTEGLQWLVLAQPITATPAQIVSLRSANGGANARPVQPLNNRPLYYSNTN